MTTERSINLAVIAGDGIGPEIITEAQRVLQRACELDSIRVDSTDYKLGAEHWLKTGETLPESTMEALKQHDAILFGAIGNAIEFSVRVEAYSFESHRDRSYESCRSVMSYRTS